ncbi:DUF6105 family protein [Jiella mangrovi]|uniref:DUF2834 domain-containing protein n=1 Tax=Jiella mangrovi TaxID=2821407 RepID=A0ABS4BF76_9HYPH|nr:DUF6105 family protein [Jiella mangrovi]MBP0615407.1 hypothetical protein [Jiella mangrovi]
MRALLLLWFAPLATVLSWYFLSLADIGQTIGGVYLSRDLNESVFLIYGHLLGIEPDRLPGMFASAIAFDTALLFAIVAFRRRRAIAAWCDRRWKRAETTGGSRAR